MNIVLGRSFDRGAQQRFSILKSTFPAIQAAQGGIGPVIAGVAAERFLVYAAGSKDGL